MILKRIPSFFAFGSCCFVSSYKQNLTHAFICTNDENIFIRFECFSARDIASFF